MVKRNISKDFEKIAKGKQENVCMFDECQRKTQKKSHSISESILKQIEKGEKLYQIQHYTDICGRLKSKFEEVTNKAGVFYHAICHFHDEKIFKEIENRNTKENYQTEAQKFLFCLKATLKHLSDCKIEKEHLREKLSEDLCIFSKFLNFLLKENVERKEILEKFEEIINENQKIDNKKIEYWEILRIIKNERIINKEDRECINFFALFNNFETRKDFISYTAYMIQTKVISGTEKLLELEETINELNKLFDKMEILRKKENYRKIKTKVIYLKEELPIAANSLFLNNVSDCIFFSMFPEQERTVCLISYFEENTLFNELINKYNNDYYNQKNIVLNLIMGTNNVVFNKKFICEKLGKNKEQFLIESLEQKRCNNVFAPDKNDKYHIL